MRDILRLKEPQKGDNSSVKGRFRKQNVCVFNTLNSLGMSNLYLHFLFVYIPRLGVFRLAKGICPSSISHDETVALQSLWRISSGIKYNYFRKFSILQWDILYNWRHWVCFKVLVKMRIRKKVRIKEQIKLFFSAKAYIVELNEH